MNGRFQHFGETDKMQEPFDLAVVMPTLLRPTLLRAIRSIITQHFQGRIQTLIGIDKRETPIEPLLASLADLPSRRVISLFDAGYSTSVRHGGLQPAGIYAPRPTARK